MALPAVAIDPEDVWELCDDWVLDHFWEPEWENACFDAVAELEAQILCDGWALNHFEDPAWEQACLDAVAQLLAQISTAQAQE